MRRMNRNRLMRARVVVVAVVGVAAVVGWVAVGFNGGVPFAIAIGTAVAVAIFSDGQGNCSPRFRRRRS